MTESKFVSTFCQFSYVLSIQIWHDLVKVHWVPCSPIRTVTGNCLLNVKPAWKDTVAWVTSRLASRGLVYYQAWIVTGISPTQVPVDRPVSVQIYSCNTSLVRDIKRFLTAEYISPYQLRLWSLMWNALSIWIISL